LVLLIGETIGWQELIFIGILALIFLGPRKLPTMARTIGKYMAEFRRAATEFKSTWESEVSSITTDFKEELKDTNNDLKMLSLLDTPKPVENSIGRNQNAAEENGPSVNGAANGSANNEVNGAAQLELPTVTQVEPSQMDQIKETAPTEMVAETVKESKKDWL
jgi:sec-independent protein translocase protein TatB